MRWSVTLMLTLGCSNATPEAVQMGKIDGATSPGDAQPLNATAATKSTPAVAAPAKIAIPDLAGCLKASYKVQVRLDGKDGPFGLLNLLHLDACNGNVDISLNPSLQVLDAGDISKFLVIGAAAPIDCPSINSHFAIAKVLSGLFSGGTPGAGLPIKKEGDILALTLLNGVAFNPARPLFPSLLAGKKQALSVLQATAASKATLDGKDYSGSFSLRMVEFGTPYKPPGMNVTFPNSMYFVDSAQGFAGLDPLKGLLFDELGFRISLDPISITQIIVKGQADRLIPVIASVPDEALDGILKFVSPLIKGVVASKGLDNQLVMGVAKDIAVTITIDLIAQEGTDKPNTSADRGESYGPATPAAKPTATQTTTPAATSPSTVGL